MIFYWKRPNKAESKQVITTITGRCYIHQWKGRYQSDRKIPLKKIHSWETKIAKRYRKGLSLDFVRVRPCQFTFDSSFHTLTAIIIITELWQNWYWKQIIEKLPCTIFFHFDWKLSLMIPMYAKVVYCTTNCKYLGLIRQ